jgi:oxalate decarboxylase/phosphoglucose isomerase-like protein (cupin superfamily)
MTAFMPVGSARTMDFNANDEGFVPANAGHPCGKYSDTELVFRELFKASEVVDCSLNQWIPRVPFEMVYSRLKLDKNTLQMISTESWRSCRDSSTATNLQTERRRHFQYAGGVCRENVMFCEFQD